MLDLFCVRPRHFRRSRFPPDETLIFTHIPKTAGTTLDHVLCSVAQACGLSWYRLNGTIYGSLLGPAKREAASRIPAEIDILRAARIVTGHLAVGLHRHLTSRAYYVVLLREPVTRTISEINQTLRSLGAEAAHAVIAEKRLVDNMQVRMLAGCEDPSVPCDEAMLDAAKKALRERIFFFGFSETFSSFLENVLSLCGWPAVLFARRNVTEASGPHIDSGLRSTLEDIDRYDTRFIDYARGLEAEKTAEAYAIASGWDADIPDDPDEVLGCLDPIRVDGQPLGLMSHAVYREVSEKLRRAGFRIDDARGPGASVQ